MSAVPYLGIRQDDDANDPLIATMSEQNSLNLGNASHVTLSSISQIEPECESLSAVEAKQNQKSQEKKRHSTASKDKKYKCNKCEYSTNNHGHFDNHLRVHSEDKPFKCTEPGCNKRFKRKQHLTSHLRMHSGEKPFVCHFGGCQATFRHQET